jgi:hypothetical protein
VQICEDILHMVRGHFVTEDEIISNVETMASYKALYTDDNVSFAERAEACA